MKNFKTPKGTELPIIQLKGKDYLQVQHRLVWFREERPEWTIKTLGLEINLDKKYAIFRTEILDETGRLRASATGTESIAGFADYVEKAETKSTGRALGLCGFGTQFMADELDEGERLADAPVAHKEETKVLMATTDQKKALAAILGPKLGMYEVAKGKLDDMTYTEAAAKLKLAAASQAKPSEQDDQATIDDFNQALGMEIS